MIADLTNHMLYIDINFWKDVRWKKCKQIESMLYVPKGENYTEVLFPYVEYYGTHMIRLSRRAIDLAFIRRVPCNSYNRSRICDGIKYDVYNELCY